VKEKLTNDFTNILPNKRNVNGIIRCIINNHFKTKKKFDQRFFVLKDFSYPERKASVDIISSLSAASNRCPTAFRARGLASKTLVNNSRTISAC
jgi:hypothetical protein